MAAFGWRLVYGGKTPPRKFTDNFSIGGIALGTIVVLVAYHGVHWLAPPHMREEPQVSGRAYEGGAMIVAGNIETAEGEVSPYRVDRPASGRE